MILNIENHSILNGDYYFDNWNTMQDFINENWEDNADYWIANSSNPVFVEVRDLR